jgi:hypothetical protein
MKTRIFHNCIMFLMIVAIVFATGCATQTTDIMLGKPPGFLMGLFHGFIILFSFFISLFTDYEIYSFPNTGGWYDFGFLLGVMMFFGGGGAGARRA